MANPSGGQSRLFLIVVLGLVGLLMVGLLSIAGLVVYTRFLAPTPSPTVVAQVTPSPEPTAAPTGTSPDAVTTATPQEQEAATPTRVIQEGSPAPEGATATATRTPTTEGGDEMAPTGFGPMEAFVGGVVLVVIILVVRRLRLSSGTS
jgi:cytoskeletal protein RodZ